RRAALEDAHRTIQQLLLPVVDLVRVHPEIHRQLGDGTVAPDCRHRHLRLERRAVLLPCPLHVLLPRYPRFLGAGLYLSHLSHFRGPAQITYSWSITTLYRGSIVPLLICLMDDSSCKTCCIGPSRRCLRRAASRQWK